MLKTLLISTFFAIVLGELKHPKEAATQTQPESCGNCHDHCWANPNGDNQEQDQAYQDIHQMVSSLRSLRVSYGADATAFIFDGTENSDQVMTPTNPFVMNNHEYACNVHVHMCTVKPRFNE